MPKPPVRGPRRPSSSARHKEAAERARKAAEEAEKRKRIQAALAKRKTIGTVRRPGRMPSRPAMALKPLVKQMRKRKKRKRA